MVRDGTGISMAEERTGTPGALLDGLKGLGPARLAAMAAVAVATLGIFAFLAMRGGGAPMSLLYADLDLREAGQIVEALDRAKIPHGEEAQGSRIMVPGDQVARARLLLARDGLPSGGGVGYEIFDRGDSLTATQFQQSIAQARALEGELSRSIRTLQGVRAARVHLVLPKREPFARERQEAQASVVLTMAGAGRLDREGVQAIMNLVAAAVPGLRPQNIAVIDNRGNLLARAGEAVGAAAAAQSAEELRRTGELRVARAVEEMLERSLGPGRVRAQASIEMDFDQLRETQEKYDPEGQVLRSQQSVSDNTKRTEQNSSVTVQNNLPNADAGAGQAGQQEQRQEETSNYEISKTIRTLVRDQPQIKRVSLAVLVDGSEQKGPDGVAIWKERSADEMARIATLVKSAIGFDEKRGDKVEIVNMRFAVEDNAAEPGATGPLGLSLDKSDLMRLGQMLLLFIAGLAALMFVIRPMAVRIGAPSAAALNADAEGAFALAGGGGLAVLGGEAGRGLAGGGRALIGSDGKSRQGGGDDQMVDIGQVEGQLRASSIRRIADLVEKHPDEALTIMRGWMVQGEQR